MDLEGGVGPMGGSCGSRYSGAVGGVAGERNGLGGVAGVVVAALIASLVSSGAGASPPGAVLPFDFDGDGYAELVVGAPGEAIGSRQAAGSVNILRGSTVGPTAKRDQLWYQAVRGVAGSSQRNDEFGKAIASGDFDRDGFADLVVGVPGEMMSASRHVGGAIQVFYGSPGGLTASRDRLWYRGGDGVPGAPTGYGFGEALAVGDFDADGFDDVAVGIPGAVLGGVVEAGQVIILRGAAGGLTAAGSQAWDQTVPGIPSEPEDLGENWGGESFGLELAAGDVNGDGRDDLAIGAPFEDRGVGAVHVVLGGMGGLTADGNQYLTGDQLDPGTPAAMDGFGRALVLADLNADGRADLVAGRTEAELGNGAKSGGRVSVMYAPPGGVFDPATAQDWNLEAHFANTDASWAWFGWSVASGDFTGDGIADLAIGASASGVAGLEQDGAVYLLLGSPGGLIETSVVLTQDTPGVPGLQESLDAFGMEEIAAARLGGGSRDWLVIGAPCEKLGRRTCAGAVTVVPGSATGLDTAGSSQWTQARPGVRGIAERFDVFGTVTG